MQRCKLNTTFLSFILLYLPARIRFQSGPFLRPVNDIEVPDYNKYIVQPMDLSMMQRNIRDNLYGSTNAFEADAKWLLHNSIIFNSCNLTDHIIR